MLMKKQLKKKLYSYKYLKGLNQFTKYKSYSLKYNYKIFDYYSMYIFKYIFNVHPFIKSYLILINLTLKALITKFKHKIIIQEIFLRHNYLNHVSVANSYNFYLFNLLFYYNKYILFFNYKKLIATRNTINLIKPKDNRIIRLEKKLTAVKRNASALRRMDYKYGILYISFSKRNTFINLTDDSGNTLLLTTVRREGFFGRRRTEYISLFSTVRSVKQKLWRYKVKTLAIIYKGWNRHRIAIRKSLHYKDNYKIKINFVRYLISLPHNGCRLRKKKKKKRRRKVRLKMKKLFNI